MGVRIYNWELIWELIGSLKLLNNWHGFNYVEQVTITLSVFAIADHVH
jgi:hypothetical protein